MEVVTGSGDRAGESAFYLVRREAVITGRDLKTARVGVDPNNQPNIHFSLNPTGAEKFGRETGRNIGRRLAIILDGSVYSAPVINSRIGAEGQIEGRFSAQEADELAKILKAGALPRQATVESMADSVLAEFEPQALEKTSLNCRLQLATALLHSMVDRLALANERMARAAQ